MTIHNKRVILAINCTKYVYNYNSVTVYVTTCNTDVLSWDCWVDLYINIVVIGVFSKNKLFIWFLIGLNSVKLFCSVRVSSQLTHYYPHRVQSCVSLIWLVETVNLLVPSSLSHHSSSGLSVSGSSDPGAADRIRLISKRISCSQYSAGGDCCLVASDWANGSVKTETPDSSSHAIFKMSSV